MILNLLSNALKFTPENGTIDITCGPDQSEEFIQVSVQDSGCGISKADQEGMFKLFGKLESSKSINKKGIGLGLYISSQIVKQFEGGEIKLDSEKGEGAKFTFKFKLIKDKQPKNKANSQLSLKSFDDSDSLMLNYSDTVYRFS